MDLYCIKFFIVVQAVQPVDDKSCTSSLHVQLQRYAKTQVHTILVPYRHDQTSKQAVAITKGLHECNSLAHMTIAQDKKHRMTIFYSNDTSNISPEDRLSVKDIQSNFIQIRQQLLHFAIHLTSFTNLIHCVSKMTESNVPIILRALIASTVISITSAFLSTGITSVPVQQQLSHSFLN